jgi:hypothetical protein
MGAAKFVKHLLRDCCATEPDQERGSAKHPDRFYNADMITCVVILLGVNSAVTWYVRRQDATIQSPMAILNQLSTVQLSSDRPSPEPLPADLLSALRTPNDFQVRHRVSDIPDSVRVAFVFGDN